MKSKSILASLVWVDSAVHLLRPSITLLYMLQMVTIQITASRIPQPSQHPNTTVQIIQIPTR